MNKSSHTQDKQIRSGPCFSRDFVIESGNFETRLVRDEKELLICQKLRYKCFFEERGTTGKVDEIVTDIFDASSDHLVVIFKETNQIVGTYRLLRRSVADKHQGFYNFTEFDLKNLLQKPGELLELSRACVEKDYRILPIVHLLWRGLSYYIGLYNVSILFGCASFCGIDPQEFAHSLAYLYHKHRAPDPYKVWALPSHSTPMNLISPQDINEEKAMKNIPSLLKGYIRLGAYVSEDAFIDHEFLTTDVCIIVKRDAIKKRYTDYYQVFSPDTKA